MPDVDGDTCLPGDPAVVDTVQGLAGKRAAAMLANHSSMGTVKDLTAACNAAKQVKDTARLAMLTRATGPRARPGRRSAT